MTPVRHSDSRARFTSLICMVTLSICFLSPLETSARRGRRRRRYHLVAKVNWFAEFSLKGLLSDRPRPLMRQATVTPTYESAGSGPPTTARTVSAHLYELADIDPLRPKRYLTGLSVQNNAFLCEMAHPCYICSIRSRKPSGILANIARDSSDRQSESTGCRLDGRCDTRRRYGAQQCRRVI